MARRSVLFSPGDRPELMRKAPAAGADTVVFDLEDAVAPARKSEARSAVAGVLTDVASPVSLGPTETTPERGASFGTVCLL